MSKVTNEQLIQIVKILSQRVATLETKVNRLQDQIGKKMGVRTGLGGPRP